MPKFTPEPLIEFATSLLKAGGATEDEAEHVARSLVDSNLRGYESHGMMRIPSYIQMLNDDVIVSGMDLVIQSESPTHIACDAGWGFGQVQAERLRCRLRDKALEQGVGVGTLLHSGHIGRLGEYCEASAKDNLVTMLMVNSHGAVVRVAPPGGKSPRLSTNPLAIGVPHPDGPLVLDFSTSATAEGKVRVKKIAGETCPDGWLLDNEGQPTNDPTTLYGDPPGSILPMGGSQAYKGFGLSLMIEILTGALSGGRCAHEPMYPKNGNCVFMLLLNPAHFGGQEHFQTEVTQLASFVRDCPRAGGTDEIMLPGDPERKTLATRLRDGIPFDDENWGKLTELAEKLGVTAPA